MANKTLNITNNGTGTLTLGGVTIGNSSIATYSSSNKKISIVGAGTTNAAINLNYIKGSVSKNFNRNFNILGKDVPSKEFQKIFTEYSIPEVYLQGAYFYESGNGTYSTNFSMGFYDYATSRYGEKYTLGNKFADGWGTINLTKNITYDTDEYTRCIVSLTTPTMYWVAYESYGWGSSTTPAADAYVFKITITYSIVYGIKFAATMDCLNTKDPCYSTSDGTFIDIYGNKNTCGILNVRFTSPKNTSLLYNDGLFSYYLNKS